MLTLTKIKGARHSSARWMYVDPSALIFSIHTDCVPSNIWAPEQQKKVVVVRSDLPTARYIIDPVSRHWQNITISRLGSVVSCALTILRMSRWPRRPITVASSRDAGNPIWNASPSSRNR